MTIEFKLDGKKRRWVAVVTKHAQSCKYNMIEKLSRRKAHCFALVIYGEISKSADYRKEQRRSGVKVG